MRGAGIALAVVATAFAAPAPVWSATFTVGSFDDQVDAKPGDGHCDTVVSKPLMKHVPVCTLRAAVQEANAEPGADTVVLPQGYYGLSRTGVDENSAATGDLDVTGLLTVTGAGVTRTRIDGLGQDRVFDVLPGGSLALTGVDVQGGVAPGELGGAIRSFEGSNVTLSGDTLEHNTAVDGAAISDAGALTVSGSMIVGNGPEAASAIFVDGSANVVGSQVIGNAGAGITVGVDGSASIGNSTIASNGFGIANEGSSLVVVRSTIAGNRGTGLANLLVSAWMSVTSSTIVGNMSSGLYNIGTAELDGVTTSGNKGGETGGERAGGIITVPPGATTLHSSILAGNLDSGGVPVNCYGAVASLGHNLDSGTSCGLTGPGDLSSTDPGLLLLADNGGPTQTEALAPGSPAIDAGDCGSLAVHQLGVPRPAGHACDIGVYEFADTADVAVALTGPTVATAGDRLTYTATVTNKGPSRPPASRSWTSCRPGRRSSRRPPAVAAAAGARPSPACSARSLTKRARRSPSSSPRASPARSTR
jgi:CSLREA domain-containing protein